jgi:H2-forming N5,N10-methylenetetrahydromethanopterin dehydrogenase-like enzyme
MKKLIVLSILVGLLTACGGEKVNTTSKSYKKELLTKAYKKHDIEAQKEYLAIQKELQELADNGSEKAEKELENWEKVAEDFKAERILEMSPETKELAAKLRKQYEND